MGRGGFLSEQRGVCYGRREGAVVVVAGGLVLFSVSFTARDWALWALWLCGLCFSMFFQGALGKSTTIFKSKIKYWCKKMWPATIFNFYNREALGYRP